MPHMATMLLARAIVASGSMAAAVVEAAGIEKGRSLSPPTA